MEYPTPAELTNLIHRYFDDRGVEVSYDPEQGQGSANGAEFSVHNLAANLPRIDRGKWSDYVA